MGWYVSIYQSDPQSLKKTTGLIGMKCTRSCFTHLVKTLAYFKFNILYTFKITFHYLTFWWGRGGGESVRVST